MEDSKIENYIGLKKWRNFWKKKMYIETKILSESCSIWYWEHSMQWLLGVCMCVLLGCELIIWLLELLPRGLSVQGVFESPQHEIRTKYCHSPAKLVSQPKGSFIGATPTSAASRCLFFHFQPTHDLYVKCQSLRFLSYSKKPFAFYSENPLI